MDSFLLLVGLALFCTGAAMYLSHASEHEPRWVVGSILMPVMVPLYYRRHWDDLQLAGLLQAAGLVMSLAGGTMMLFEKDMVLPEVSSNGAIFSSKKHNHDGFVDSDRSLGLIARHGSGVPVAGRLNGSEFHPDRVDLIDGVLRLRQGHRFVPDLEVAVFLDKATSDGGRIKRVVGPDEQGAPEVQMTWLGEDGQPVTRLIRGGYRLDLELVPMARGKLGGYVQLTLPDIRESYVSGDVEVVTNHLRYRDGEVDRFFDHIDTLTFIAQEYLETQYKAADMAEVRLEGSMMDVLAGRAETLATVVLDDGRVGRHVIKAARNEFGWSVLGIETAAATAAAGYKSVFNVLPPEALREPRVVKKVAVPSTRERTLAFSELSSLAGKGAVVEWVGGRREQGVLRGLDGSKLVIEATKSGGIIQFKVSAAELASLRLSSGEVIHIAGAASAGTSSAPVSQAEAAQETVRVGDLDLTRFMNKNVRIVTLDGKVTTGIFRGVQKDRLVVETQVGSGRMDYTLPAGQLSSIDFSGR